MKVIRLMALFSSFILMAVPLIAAVGDLDAGFGSGGKVVTDLGGNEEASAVLVYPDGKILIAGSYQFAAKHAVLVRYQPDGSLDPSFGTAGKLILDKLGTSSSAASVALQPDGKILVAGYAFDAVTKHDFFLARVEENGQGLDAGFGNNGQVVTDFGNKDMDFAKALVLQADGKIVVGGYMTSTGGNMDFALIRYDSTGALDETFGSKGLVTTDNSFQDDVRALGVDKDGNIVAGGIAKYASEMDFVLLLYSKTDGSILKNVHVDFNNYFDWATDLAVDASGRILIVGYSFDGSSDEHISAARYLPDFTLDTNFGTGGRATVETGSNDGQPVTSVALLKSGKILLAGSSIIAPSVSRDFVVARLQENGQIDAGFGNAGKVVVNISSDPNEDFVTDLAVQQDGNIVAVGYTVPSFSDFALARFQGDPPPADDGGGSGTGSSGGGTTGGSGTTSGGGTTGTGGSGGSSGGTVAGSGGTGGASGGTGAITQPGVGGSTQTPGSTSAPTEAVTPTDIRDLRGLQGQGGGCHLLLSN